MRSAAVAFRTAIAASDRGTRCGFPAFIRAAGTVQAALPRSISFQRTPLASPLLAAVRIVNCRQSAPVPVRSRSAVQNAGISCHGNAAWCSTGATLSGAGRTIARLPRHVAGLEPVRQPLTVAYARMVSIRPLSREAVSVFVVQIGCRTLRTSRISIEATSRLPMSG